MLGVEVPKWGWGFDRSYRVSANFSVNIALYRGNMSAGKEALAQYHRSGIGRIR